MKKQILLILIGIIISLGLMLSSVLADDMIIQAQELLEKYSKAPPPPELNDPGDWDVIMRSKQAGPMVNCMPHYYSWVGREITIWGNVHWGDAADKDFWERVELASKNRQDSRIVQLAILAMPSQVANLIALQELQSISFRGSIAVMAKYDDDVAELKAAGADLVFNLYTAAASGFADHIFTASDHSEPVAVAG